MTDKAVRQQILEEGITITMGDRNKDYGTPVDNHENIAALVGAYLGIRQQQHNIDEPISEWLDAEDAAWIMSLMKVARAAGRLGHKFDTFVDAATYAAIAGECSADRNRSEYVTDEEYNAMRKEVQERLEPEQEAYVNERGKLEAFKAKALDEPRPQVDTNFLEVLKRHTEWLDGVHNRRKADFTNAKLAEHDFSGRTLRHAIFRDADLYRANFTFCDLHCVDFRGANLTKTDFTGAYLTGTGLTKDLLSKVGAVFDRATFDEEPPAEDERMEYMTFCPDGSACNHDCYGNRVKATATCWRVLHDTPRTETGYTNNEWPDWVKRSPEPIREPVKGDE